MPIKDYPFSFEVEGPMAMFASHPDSGSERSTSLVPTPTAIKGMAESILFLRHAEVIPVKAHICAPIRTYEAGYNYRYGPLVKSYKNAVQERMTVLGRVVYQLFCVARDAKERTGKHRTTKSEPYFDKVNSGHSYQEQFERRLKSGNFYRDVCLGRKTCHTTYVGPLRESTKTEDINMTIPFLLKNFFTEPTFGVPNFKNTTVYRNIEIKNGVIVYV